MNTVSVSPKFQITLTEEVRKFFPQLKPGDKVLLGYDPVFKAITVTPSTDWKNYKGILKNKTNHKFISVEAEESQIEQAFTQKFSKKDA